MKLRLLPCELWVENMTECGFGTTQCSVLATALCQRKLVLPMDPAVCLGTGSSKSQLPCIQIFLSFFSTPLFHLCCRLNLRPSTCLLFTFFLVIYIYFGRESISPIPKSSSPQANGFGGVWEIKDGKQSYECQWGCRVGSASSSSEPRRKKLSSFIGQEGDN